MTDRMLGAGFAALGVVLLVMSIQLPAPMAATRISYGPGFFPTILSIVIVVAGVVMCALNAPEPAYEDEDDDSESSGMSYWRPCVVGLAAIAYIMLVGIVGFPVLAAIILFILLKMGKVGTGLSALIALIGALVIYLIFARLLLVPLPLGVMSPLGGYLR
jgi:putative tricarboxylic transport membrane protein